MIQAIVIGLILITIVLLLLSISVHPFFLLLLLIPFLSILGMYRSRTSTQRKLKHEARLLENTFLDPILRDALVIDTTLWQHAEYQSFFDTLSIILKRIGKKYILFDEQYNELIQGSLQKDSATTDTRTSSAHTQSILDQIKEQGLIAFEPPQVSLDDSMFEQPPIIRVLAGAAQKTHNVTFVSESRGLIASARNYLKKKKIGITIIDDLESLLPQCVAYCNAVREGIVIPLPRYKG